ncbi:MAG: hypothetical protein ACLT2T_12840 [Bilophila wadsworthia]
MLQRASPHEHAGRLLSATPITVNAVSPGWIQVDGYDAFPWIMPILPGVWGIPRDIVNACLFLAHGKTISSTGTTSSSTGE